MADVELAGRGGSGVDRRVEIPAFDQQDHRQADLLGGEAKSARNRSKKPGLAVLLHGAEHRLERQFVVLVEADRMALLVAREESDARARQEAAAFGQLVFDPGGAEEVGLDRHYQAVADLAVFEMEAAGVEPQHGQESRLAAQILPAGRDHVAGRQLEPSRAARARHRQAAGLAGMFDELQELAQLAAAEVAGEHRGLRGAAAEHPAQAQLQLFELGAAFDDLVHPVVEEGQPFLGLEAAGRPTMVVGRVSFCSRRAAISSRVSVPGSSRSSTKRSTPRSKRVARASSGSSKARTRLPRCSSGSRARRRRRGRIRGRRSGPNGLPRVRNSAPGATRVQRGSAAERRRGRCRRGDHFPRGGEVY